MKSLIVHVEFVAHSYQGVRLTLHLREELDWPPAPGRLHQAMMAAGLTGVPDGSQERSVKEALEALRWLENQ